MKRLFLIAVLCVLSVLPAAAEVKIFRGASRDATLKGKVDGLAVDEEGALTLARKVERLAGVDEPFVYAAAPHPDGWVLGTGSSGRVLLVDREGNVEELFAAAEGQIFAVHADDDGTVWAGSSPYGKVYKHKDGETWTVFEPGAAYVWALRRDAGGRLLVATGFPGHLYRLPDDDGAAKGEAEVLYESPDSHVRSVAVAADGSVYAGTAGHGLVVRLRDGKRQTVLDAVLPEVVDFTVAGDDVYAAVIASEASQVDLSTRQAPARKSSDSNGDGSEAEVTVKSAEAVTVGSRGSGAAGPRSRVLRISQNGTRVEEVAAFKDETVHAIHAHDSELWIGTGQEGRLYRLPKTKDAEPILERDLEERQIAALAGHVPLGGTRGENAVAVVTTNAAAVYQVGSGSMDAGTYTSDVLDAEQVARFGTLRWEGSLPAGTSASFEARSGLSQTPDATWTEWQAVGGGHEASLADVPQGRFVQWRVRLEGEGASPRILTTELAYRQQNQAPEIESFEVKPPGEILVPSSFNPQNQVYEPWSPNREGIFTSLQPEKKNGDSRLKSLWRKGYRSLQWTVKDPNGETLEYALEVRNNGHRSEEWLPIVRELDESYYVFDATVLPDGVYRFRLTASDAPDRYAEALTADVTSEPVTVDHTPPELVRATRKDGRVTVELKDALSPLRDVAFSVDAADWQDVSAADGLLDSRAETLSFPVPDGARLVLLRATDAAWNVVTLDLGSHLK